MCEGNLSLIPFGNARMALLNALVARSGSEEQGLTQLDPQSLTPAPHPGRRNRRFDR